MKTLYITDLDGTLLNCDSRISEDTAEVINRLTEQGMCFSYATARSLSSASVATEGLTPDIPVIVYNGTFIIQAKSREVLYSLEFRDKEQKVVSEFLMDAGIYPLVYAYVNGKERVSWLRGSENDGMSHYLGLRQGDERLRCVEDIDALYEGNVFYYTCIGSKEELKGVYDRFRDDEAFTCLLQQEAYPDDYWCEIMPKKATKGNAILKLKELLSCDRIVSFGDGLNDMAMFEISDECYAMANAVDELKACATGVISSNADHGVARWLEQHFKDA